MKTIYWSKYNVATNSNDLLWDIRPKPLYHYVKSQYGLNYEDSINWLKCPASIDLLSSTYYIENPLQIDLSIKEGDTVYSDTPYSKNILNFRSFNHEYAIIDYLISLTLFSKEDIEVSTINPFISPQSNIFAIPGKFNISKWFRPINPSFMVKAKNCDIQFKKESPMIYLQFNTSEKIEFKEFYFTDTLKEVSIEMVGYKRYSKKNSLHGLYSIFDDRKIKKVIISEIEKALI